MDRSGRLDGFISRSEDGFVVTLKRAGHQLVALYNAVGEQHFVYSRSGNQECPHLRTLFALGNNRTGRGLVSDGG